MDAAHLTGTVLLTAGSLVVLAAAGPKLRGRGPTVALGGLELIAGLAALGLDSPIAAGGLAALFACFAAVHARALHAGRSDCDCFGEGTQSPPLRGLLLTALAAAGIGAAAACASPSLLGLARHGDHAVIWVPGAAVVLAGLWRMAFSPQSLLAPAPASATEPDRRSFLLQVAVVGSALATAPLRFLLYPGTALGAVIAPGSCGSGACTDGYTGFCCEITEGHANACPTGTFPGGWWMCTDYRGRQLCADQGVRYYVDCNALPGGHGFPGGCRCGSGGCDSRRLNCNVFRYGQCNTHIEGITAVVCRMILCENPARVSALHCSAALAVDDSTCGHEAPSLEPPALQLSGAGGA